jgi:hypothetical protein
VPLSTAQAAKNSGLLDPVAGDATVIKNSCNCLPVDTVSHLINCLS